MTVSRLEWATPSALPELHPSDVHVWRVDPDLAACSPALSQVLSPDEQERSRRFRFDRDRNLFIAARGCLRHLLGHCLEQSPRDIVFQYNSHGRPHLAHSDMQFNITHTEGMALVALTRGRRLGIDIERRDRSVNVMEIGKRFFSPREYEALCEAPDPLQAFLCCWTRKEAFVKALGGGLSIPLDRFHVSLDDPPHILDIEWAPETVGEWRLESLPVDGEFVAALAVSPPEFNLHTFQWG